MGWRRQKKSHDLVQLRTVTIEGRRIDRKESELGGVVLEFYIRPPLAAVYNPDFINDFAEMRDSKLSEVTLTCSDNWATYGHFRYDGEEPTPDNYRELVSQAQDVFGRATLAALVEMGSFGIRAEM